eukprot:scaffold7356_cov249-Pinguiococcus_pyrenoidosus.AAC.16
MGLGCFCSALAAPTTWPFGTQRNAFPESFRLQQEVAQIAADEVCPCRQYQRHIDADAVLGGVDAMPPPGGVIQHVPLFELDYYGAFIILLFTSVPLEVRLGQPGGAELLLHHGAVGEVRRAAAKRMLHAAGLEPPDLAARQLNGEVLLEVKVPARLVALARQEHLHFSLGAVASGVRQPEAAAQGRQRRRDQRRLDLWRRPAIGGVARVVQVPGSLRVVHLDAA